MEPNTQRLIQGAAGAAGEKIYVEDVFSTYLYTGNGSTQTITNGIDLAGEGGLVWIKERNVTGSNHHLVDSERGKFSLYSNSDVQSFDLSSTGIYGPPNGTVAALNSDGFYLDGPGYTNNGINVSNNTYTSWTFRKAPNFFDVVTYTGDGTAGRTVSHNLGSTPGLVVIKRRDSPSDWVVWHRSLSLANAAQGLRLNGTDALGTPSGGGTVWSSTTPMTSTTFGVASSQAGDWNTNINGGTYVAYLFAHDAGGFGAGGTESVIKCGSFSYTGGTPLEVNLGWEAQWVLVKKTNGTDSWFLTDTMRGMIDGDGTYVQPNTANAEGPYGIAGATSTGFIFDPGTQIFSSGDFIYIAIRRGPMKTPTDATKVFNATSYTGDGSTPRSFTTGVTADAIFYTNPPSNWTSGGRLQSRLTNTFLTTQFTNDESSSVYFSLNDSSANTGVTATSANYNNSGTSYLLYSFRRAPGFFDVVAYTGTGSVQAINHNLGVTPELMIVKSRNGAYNWGVYHQALGNTTAGYLNSSNAPFPSIAFWNNTTPTSTSFTVYDSLATGTSSTTYIAYLFATCPGVSKVGSYTGTGTTLDVDCGFAAGSRLVLIKRTDSTGDWYVWDTARGIVSGNDPYLLLNSTAAEVTSTDYIDPLSSGFQISSSAPAAINANGGSFIFLAIA